MRPKNKPQYIRRANPNKSLLRCQYYIQRGKYTTGGKYRTKCRNPAQYRLRPIVRPSMTRTKLIEFGRFACRDHIVSSMNIHPSHSTWEVVRLSKQKSPAELKVAATERMALEVRDD